MALWVIIVSCLVKVCVQLEFGKHAISSGESTMAALDSLPGPRLSGVSWTIWMWLLVQLVIFVQYGGIVTGVGQAINIAIPAVPVSVWASAAGLATAVLVSCGRYRTIQNVSVALMGLFTLFTLMCVGLLQGTEYAVSSEQVASGLTFSLPRAVLGAAVAAFGLTGVGASEIIAYPYWCLEKGYAGFTGPREPSDQWVQRARGWIRVMYWDALLSMLVYTLMTCAFYLLGASVLHGRGEVPKGSEMIRVLSRIYTETAGVGAMALYLIGAIIVLFSTLFAGSAAWTRMFSDAFAQVGLLDYSNETQRQRWIRGFRLVFSVVVDCLGADIQGARGNGHRRWCGQRGAVTACCLCRPYLSLPTTADGIATRCVLRLAAMGQLHLNQFRRCAGRCQGAETACLNGSQVNSANVDSPRELVHAAYY